MLTDLIPARHDFAVHPARRPNDARQGSAEKTLGDLLYANQAHAPTSEQEWVRLVRSIAAGDQLALHLVYEQTHRIVFDPQQAHEFEEQSRLLRNALEVLTPEERQVIETAFFSELTYQGVGLRTDVIAGMELFVISSP